MACNHSRQQRHRIRAAIDAEGRIALDDEFFPTRAYVRTHGARRGRTAGMLPGPYRVPAYRVAGHYRLTNKTPAATYRAPGRYESTFACERLLDAIAAKIGIDRIEVRRRNLILNAEMPYTRALEVLDTGLTLDSGDYTRLLDKVLAQVGWEKLQLDLTPQDSG
jgi:CO/xanthine dehydrogenase Mo-binding subunit